MALVLKDRVKETTTTTGTGTITLAGASAGFQAFSVIGDGNSTYYAIKSGNNWEVGVGTYTLSGTTLARTTILESSNSGSAITLAGTSDVFCTYPAEKAVTLNGTVINDADVVATANIVDDAVTDVKIDTMSSSKLTGAMPAIDGSSLTGITADNSSDLNIVTSATATNRTVTYSATWTQHLQTANFTTTAKNNIFSNVILGHGYEAGVVRVQTQMRIYNSAGTDLTSTTLGDSDHQTYGGFTSGVTNYYEAFKQGHSTNHAMGNHAVFHIFPSVPAGTYNIRFFVRNLGGSSTAIFNNWLGQEDRLTVWYGS